MFTHAQVWAAIDALARENGYSTSGLAKKSGLDSTTFNRSKRIGPGGKPRWPSTESVARVLTVTGTPLSTFARMVEEGQDGA
jgi:phage repressor protein C with HTH and peptisase S24 domain